MLVLSRKSCEKILIGDDITVTILRVQGGTVKVGIEAPPDVRVLRDGLAPSARIANASRCPRESRDATAPVGAKPR